MNTGSKVRFLVVDDNLDILEAYTGLLRILGLVVETAVDGSVAWHKLQNSDFDIVLSDVRMPVMDGVELLKKIRERNGQSPCVILIVTSIAPENTNRV